ncbi:3727_t:CDS:2, partial [Racocetra persica]
MSIQPFNEKKKSLSSGLKNYIVERQIGAILISYFLAPDPQNPFSKFLFISYPIYKSDGTVLYGKGYWDLAYVTFWVAQENQSDLWSKKPRKDLLQLVAHHIITILLIGGSYISNFTRIGNTVFITMDASDIWLGLSKCLKYMAFPNYVTNTMFIIFMIVWVYSRHYLYWLVTYSLWADSCLPENNECIWDPLNGYWLTPWSKYIVLLGMTLLQILMIYWFTLILRIAWKVVNGNNAEDTRSDSE